MRSVIGILACAACAAAQEGWTRVGDAPASEVLSFSVSLPTPEAQDAELDARFRAISDPSSPHYQEFLTGAEVQALRAADPAVKAEVLAWLESGDAVACKPRPASLKCRAPVSSLSQLLSARFYTFEHQESGVTAHRLVEGEYEIPDEMEGKINFIAGLNQLPLLKARYGRQAVAIPSPEDPYILPETLKNLYNVGETTAKSDVIVSAAEFQSYPSYVPSDLARFLSWTSSPAFTVAKKVGTFLPSPSAVESELDVQTLGAMATGATNWYWTTADWMYGWTEDLTTTSDADLPFIFSISYGWNEQQQCQIAKSAKPCAAGGTSEQFVTETNKNFKAVGARGVTFVVATGDSGCHGRTDPFCLKQTLNPDYPTGSPYVTAVGATQLVDAVVDGAKSNICTNSSATEPYPNGVMGKCGVSGREIVSSTETGSLITTGGGFSAYASRAEEASYQDAVVKTYLSNSSAVPAEADFNSAGRGYPDVAALGHNYLVAIGGRAAAVDGTSAACPAFAGLLGLVTSELGGKRLGFANPLIYQTAAKDAAAFNDITQGRNWSTEDNHNCPNGYNAAPGWDATTGLGTMNLAKFVSAAQAVIAEGKAQRNLRH